jgi:hypothetical protein
MSITDANITSSLWNEVKSILVASAPYVTAGVESTDTVVASIKGTYSDTAASRPTIVINPIVMDEGEWKFGSNQGHKFLNITIDCYYSRSLGVDELFDQVQHALKTNVINGVELVAVASDIGFSSANDNKYHVKTGTFTYDRE